MKVCFGRMRSDCLIDFRGDANILNRQRTCLRFTDHLVNSIPYSSSPQVVAKTISKFRIDSLATKSTHRALNKN